MPLYHGASGSLWYSISPFIRPHSVFIMRRTLFASSVGIGSGRESTEGGGEMSGDVGREVLFINFVLVEAFLSFIVADWNGASPTRFCCTEGKPVDEVTEDVKAGIGGPLRSSWTGIDPIDTDDENDPIRCRLFSTVGASC